jgi:hypothetical protein
VSDAASSIVGVSFTEGTITVVEKDVASTIVFKGIDDLSGFTVTLKSVDADSFVTSDVAASTVVCTAGTPN